VRGRHPVVGFSSLFGRARVLLAISSGRPRTGLSLPRRPTDRWVVLPRQALSPVRRQELGTADRHGTSAAAGAPGGGYYAAGTDGYYAAEFNAPPTARPPSSKTRHCDRPDRHGFGHEHDRGRHPASHRGFLGERSVSTRLPILGHSFPPAVGRPDHSAGSGSTGARSSAPVGDSATVTGDSHSPSRLPISTQWSARRGTITVAAASVHR
jgi:hypothetical protein